MFVFGALLACAQATVHYLPMAPGAMMQTGKWIVANSGANFLITNPDGTTSTVAKAAATTQSVVMFALPANAVVLGCTAKSGTAFTGTTALTATVGVTGTLTACVDALRPQSSRVQYECVRGARADAHRQHRGQ